MAFQIAPDKSDLTISSWARISKLRLPQERRKALRCCLLLFWSFCTGNCGLKSEQRMGLTNFVLTVAGVSAVILLLRSDVKQSASIFRRNVKHIRHWLEEESAEASKAIEKSAKELESKVSPKDIPKKDKD